MPVDQPDARLAHGRGEGVDIRDLSVGADPEHGTQPRQINAAGKRQRRFELIVGRDFAPFLLVKVEHQPGTEEDDPVCKRTTLVGAMRTLRTELPPLQSELLQIPPLRTNQRTGGTGDNPGQLVGLVGQSGQFHNQRMRAGLSPEEGKQEDHEQPAPTG